MRNRWNRTTDASTEPVTLALVKSHLRVDHSDEDDLLNLIITAARQWAEEYTRRSFVTQTWTLDMDDFPAGTGLPLRYGSPLQSVSSVKYYDSDETLQTWSADEYHVDTKSIVGRVVLDDGYSWPSDLDDRPNCVTVTYVAGYGDEATDVPAAIRLALLEIIANGYENRVIEVTGATVARFAAGAMTRLQPYQVLEA